MKELIRKNKFKHKPGHGGYKATIPLWTKKEYKLHEAGILDPLNVAHCARKIGSRVGLVQMTVDMWSLQTLILLE
jgi:hypothetical protein